MGSSANKLNLVCIPYPAQGHIKPMFQLAKLLHSKGFHITFVNTEYNHRRLLRARGSNSADGLEHFKFEAISDGLPPSDADVTQDIPTLCDAIMSNKLLEPFKNLLRKLNDPSSGSPPVTCVISDSVMPFTIDATREVDNTPLVWLWTASVCGFMGYSQYRPLINKGIVPFQDPTFLTDGSLEKIIDWVPNSLKGIQLKYIPNFIQTTNKDDVMLNFLMLAAETTAKSSAPVIFNSFDAFEQDVLSDSAKLIGGPFYTIGPLNSLVEVIPQDPSANSLGSNLWKEDEKCLRWLDSKRSKSVVYVSFGSITTMTSENLVEFAWGLANSNHFFLWVLRNDLVNGEKSVIPNEFLLETRERGLITSWCDQETVLKHSSVGGFLTHCGWNSTLDTICGGVPVLCWPFFAEQQTNCWFSCGKWGIGLEIDGNVDRTEVEKQVRELMEGEKGEEMRKNAMEWKRLGEEAMEKGFGSSYLNFNKLVNDVLLPMEYLGM
ncbi:7-deoxyloganetin glucosyltransferase-like isoform X2 [Silene latifolia]|uniref:7-deoxyloganetin glucosyltransferase-like isoform X2 n=1 Tax=Silene latifolia TaxID=37657 RepID=UPI003D77B64C